MEKRILTIIICFLLVLCMTIPAGAANLYNESESNIVEENPDTSPGEDVTDAAPSFSSENEEGMLYTDSALSESESNNTRATADTMNVGDSMTGYIGTSTDIDCFKIIPSSGGTLSVTMSSIPSGKVYKLCLQNSSGSALVYATNNSSAVTSKSFTYNVTSGTKYYIVAYSAGDYHTSDSYKISTSISGGGSSQILSVRRYEQKEDNWCWAACIKMTAKFEEYSKTQTQIVTHVFGSAIDQTAYMSDVRDTLIWISSSTFGNAGYYNVTSARYQTNIVNQINASKPVQVACMPSSGSGHSYLITGLEDNTNTVVMIDPWYNQTTLVRISKDELLNGFECYALDGQVVRAISSIKY